MVTAFRDGTVTLRENRRTEGYTFAQKEIGYQGIRCGDLVVHEMDAFAGAIGIADSEGKGTPVYTVLRARDEKQVDLHYYAYLLRSLALDGFVESLVQGIRERSTDFRFKILRELALPVPSLQEQQSIVRVLDHKTAEIDRLIEHKERLIELLEEKRAAVITRAVTKGLDPDVEMKDSGVEWLGEIPAHWRLPLLSRVTTSRCDGPFGSSLSSKHYSAEGVRVVRLQNIGAAAFKDGDQVFVSEDHYKDLGDHDVQQDDLLIAGLGDSNNPVGRACVAPRGIEPAMVKADCFRYRLDPTEVLPSFAAFQLSALAPVEAAAMATGSTRARLNLSAMSSRRLALPPVDEQREIVAFTSQATQQLGAVRSTIDQAITLLREYRTALISAAVTGKIDVRDMTP